MTWRASLPILVTDAQAMGSLGVIRSLGRAGYCVIAASSDRAALGLYSKFATQAVVCPGYQSADFLPWLQRMIQQRGIAAIIPSEAFLHAVRGCFQDFSALLPMSKDPVTVYAGLSKHDLFARFTGSTLRNRLPEFILLGNVPLDSSLTDKLGYPIFAKFDRVHAIRDADNTVVRIGARESVEPVVSGLLQRYHRGIVQGYCPGIGVGAFLLYWNGRELGHFMHQRVHEVPHSGGASSFRRAWHQDDILEDARARARAIGLQGVAMFEYRWDPKSRQFWLIELNARFWGSLHLALYAGMDFPRLLMDAFFGQDEQCSSYDRRVACRWTFPREVEYVLSCARDPSLPWRRRCWPFLEFFLLGADPRVRADLLFPGDRKLYLRSMRQTFMKFLL
jgi:predicted ATP-grasp superfamily ATP-dependent carboligase